MGSRRIIWLLAVILTAALPWLAMADNQSRPLLTRYKLKNASARQVAKSLSPLFHGRENVKILVQLAADQREDGNEVLVTAAKEDQATIGAFLALVDRRSKLLFPEEVERAMMGERLMRPSKWFDYNEPLPRSRPKPR